MWSAEIHSLVLGRPNKQEEPGRIVRLVMRQTGSRRMGLPVDFPLTDENGSLVVHDRRRLPDRRKPVRDNNNLKVILLEMSSD